MNKIRFSDYIFGLILFNVSGGFADEFIEYCSKNKALIYNLKRNGNEIEGACRFAEIRKIDEAAKNSGMSLSVTKRYGLPHLFYRYRKRYGIPVGLLVFTVITAILHSVIWSVEISPTELIPSEEIIDTLKEAGFCEGAFSAALSCKEAEYLLYEKFDDISWVNVRVTGTRLFVTISEVKAKEKLKTDKFTNIVAGKDGEIINAEIFRGEGKIYPGTAVVKGDMLISGIVNHRDGSVKFVDSEGQIFARTKNFLQSSIPQKINVSSLKICKDIYFPVFFGITLKDIHNVKDSYFTEVSCFCDGGDVIFPIGVIRKHIYSFEDAALELSDNESALLCFRDFSFLSVKLYENAEILEMQISRASGNGAQFSGSFLCIEDIAEKKEFTVEDTSPSR